jgi:filamentous hemagglutinin family protein
MKHIVHKLFFGAVVATLVTSSHALPVFFSFESGVADIVTSGSSMWVSSSTDTVINWRSFDVAAGETLTFKGLNPGISTSNRVVGGLPMVIAGQLNLIDENVVLTADSIQISGSITTTDQFSLVATAPSACLSISSGTCSALTLVDGGTVRLPPGSNIVLTPGIVTLVPEPETYAMMFSGLLAVFGYVRRKKSSVA